MTHIPVQLPFKGFTEQNQFSVVPAGMTPSCLNVMPSDVWNGRMRISTRNGTRRYNEGSVQFMSTYRVYENGVIVEKLIFVRSGLIYYSDPGSTTPATATLFGGQGGGAKLNTTGLVEGVQFNEHFFFVDGTHYVLVHITTPSSATAVEQWGQPGGSKYGPFHTDPNSVQDGERATLICRWGPRLVLAGYRRTPNIWYACETDKPYPFTGSSGGAADGWTGTNYIGAISGSTYAPYGTLGDPIVAIFPFAQSGLMFGCTNSFSFLTSDPVFDESVSMVSLTRSIGIAGSRAFCQSQEKGAFILANDGLYFLNANDFNFNRGNRVSAGRLDSFFLRLDFGTPAIGGSSILSGGTLRSVGGGGSAGTGSTVNVLTSGGGVTQDPDPVTVDAPPSVAALIGTNASGEVFPTLCYDPDREGIWMFLTVSGSEQSSIHVYYDLKTDSFWPQRFSDPLMYGPSSACYVGQSRTKSGRLFMGGSQSISIMDRAYPIGVDGYYAGIGEDPDLQRTRFVRSSVTMGPIIAPLPYRMQINEVRVDLADDVYEVPSDWTDGSQKPIVSISTGETAQSALGLQSDSLFVTNMNELVIECGNAATTTTDPAYDGGSATTASWPNRIDGRFAIRPFGLFTQADPFAEGTARIYDGPGDWTIEWSSADSKWIIENNATGVDEYRQITGDRGSPDGMMEDLIQLPQSADVNDSARVSGASFPTSVVTEIGEIDSGRNPALHCRIRSEAAYVTIASDGHPFALERVSLAVTQVGKSRGVNL